LTFRDARTRARPFLSDRELQALSVQRGSLTREEFAEIQSHVVHTYEFLKKIPWGRSFPNVPSIAGKHHEKLDGSGYPESELSQDIPTQTRIMTIADIFDALTASDRPYKKAVPVEKALDILEMEVKGQKIDKDLFDLFVESKVYNTVLEK
ncbi:MAG: HD domain-containing protein, partial [Proteobacteria bacterium]